MEAIVYDRRRITLVFLLISSFLIQMLVGVVGIAIPIYAYSMGASELVLGVIGAAGGLTYSFMPVVSGFLSDKFRRKTFIITSISLYGLSCTFYALAENPYILIPIKALEWVSVSLFWPSLEALLVEVDGEKIENTLKKFNLSWGSAAVIGPIVGGSLISFLGIGARMPFLISLTIAFILSIITVIVIEEKPREGTLKAHEKYAQVEDEVDSILTAIISILLFSSLMGIVLNLFPAYATDLGIPAYEVGLILLFNGLFRLMAFLEAYRIEATIGEARIFLSGSLTLALASALTAVSYTTLMFSISLSIVGFGAGILYAASIARIFKRWGSTKGYAAGIFESFIGAGYFLGSLVGGFAAEYSPNMPYIIWFLLSLAVSLLQISRRVLAK